MAKTEKRENDKDAGPHINSPEENGDGEKNLQSTRTKVTKGERRARKLISTLGLKALPDVHKIIVKKTAKMAFAIVNAEVYKINGTDSYVIFGDARSDDLSNPLNSLVSDKLKNVKVDVDTLAAAAAVMAEGKDLGKGKENIFEPALIEEKIEDEESDKELKTKEDTSLRVPKKTEVVVETADTDNAELQVDPDDVQLVVGQTGSTEEEACACLRKNKNDIVQTIIELSK